MASYNHEDVIEWIHNYETYCDCCGELTKHYKNYQYWFDTMDGGDCMDSTECWRCVIKSYIRTKIKRIKKTIYCKYRYIINLRNLKKLCNGNQETYKVLKESKLIQDEVNTDWKIHCGNQRLKRQEKYKARKERKRQKKNKIQHNKQKQKTEEKERFEWMKIW